jgi:anti-sigma factor RsiW
MAAGPSDMDALLVAYLDGELDPQRNQELEERLRGDAALKARLAALAEAGRPLRSAFDALLGAAPRDRLEAAFAAARGKVQGGPQSRYRRMLMAAAASLLLLLCGGVIGYFVAKAPAELFEDADELEEDWVGAVAGQLSLYTAASLAAIQVSDAELDAQLGKLGEMLGLDLSKPRVIFEGLTLKRAELLHLEGRAIAELLYASEDHGPVALCIMAAPGGEGEGEVESRDGLNLMYWAQSGRRFLLIGDAPAERIESLAETVASAFETR